MRKCKFRRVLVGLTFLLVCIFSVLFLSYMFRPVSNSRKNICGFYAEEKNSLDMVYIGGSACYRFWQPLQAWNEYGFTSYNLATDAIQPQVLKYLIREVQKTQTPELYVIDLRPFQYGDLIDWSFEKLNMEAVAPFRNVSDNMKYSANRFWMINSGAPSEEAKWTYHFDFAKYHSLIASIVMEENWRYADNEEALYNKGYWVSDVIGTIERTDVSSITEQQPLTSDIDGLFRDLLNFCKENNLQVLFVVHPYQIEEEDQRKYNYMKKTIHEYGFGYLNVNDYFEEAGFDVNRDFYDGNHTNLLGANKYTDFLAEYMKDNYEFPEHRDDIKYHEWDICFEQWNQEMEVIYQGMVQ